MRATKAIIHLDNFKHNIKEIRRFTKTGVKMCVPVKADAYGHGSIECARAALEAGVDFLAVATVEEGVELREGGIQGRILLFSLASPEEINDAVKANLTPFVFDEEYIDLFAKEVSRQGKKDYAVHLAVDTGMGRIGCYSKDAASLAKHIAATKVLLQEGTMTHFATSDGKSTSDCDYTKKQFEDFKVAIRNIEEAGLSAGICHCANSAATLDLPETHMGMVRPGIIVYGYDADEVNAQYLATKGTPIDLKPVMTLQTEVCAIRPFKKGMSIGYGRTWTAKEDTDVAVLPIGYGDGFLRRFAQKGIKVAIKGRAYPVCGRICMDQCMVDIGKDNKEIQRWDKAVIFGCKEDGALQTAQDISDLTETISYEITTVLTRRVPREFVK